MTKWFWLIIFAAFSGHGALSGTTVATTAAQQAVLVLHSVSDQASVKKNLPRQVKILAAIDRITVVRKQGSLTDQDLNRLRKIPGVESVNRDREVRAQIEPCPAPPAVDALPVQTGVQLGNQVAQACSCQITQECPGSQLRKLWAQEDMNGDLMLAEIKRLKIRDGAVKVAVLDTGFDLQNQRANLANLKFKVARGFKGAGEPGIDEAGHGTAVTGVIGGKDGLGLAPGADLTVYRVTEPGDNETTSKGLLIASALQACADGNEVINMSFSDEADQIGVRHTLEQDFPSLLQIFSMNGCSLVVASGNDGEDSRDQSHNQLDDALLRVEASGRYDGRTEFSTLGEIAAPGDAVFTLFSSRAPDYSFSLPHDQATCSDLKTGSVSGTSFAAPLTAAVLSQVKAVLKQGSKYSALSAPDRVRLANRILKASVNGDKIDALRAIKIAEIWNETPTLANDVAPETLKLALKAAPPSECSQPTPACTSLKSCDDKMHDCVSTLRTRLSLCTSDSYGMASTDFVQMIELAGRSDNLELLRHWVSAYRAWQLGHPQLPRYELPSEMHRYVREKLQSGGLNGFAKLSLYVGLLQPQSFVPAQPDLGFTQSMLDQIQEELIHSTPDYSVIEMWNTLTRSRLADAPFLWNMVKSSMRDPALGHIRPPWVLHGSVGAIATANISGDEAGRLLTFVTMSPLTDANLLATVCESVGDSIREIPQASEILNLVESQNSSQPAKIVQTRLIIALLKSRQPIDGAGNLAQKVLESPQWSALRTSGALAFKPDPSHEFPNGPAVIDKILASPKMTPLQLKSVVRYLQTAAMTAKSETLRSAYKATIQKALSFPGAPPQIVLTLNQLLQRLAGSKSP